MEIIVAVIDLHLELVGRLWIELVADHRLAVVAVVRLPLTAIAHHLEEQLTVAVIADLPPLTVIAHHLEVLPIAIAAVLLPWIVTGHHLGELLTVAVIDLLL